MEDALIVNSMMITSIGTKHTGNDGQINVNYKNIYQVISLIIFLAVGNLTKSYGILREKQNDIKRERTED